MTGLCELEAAVRAGFKRWSHFRLARDKGLFPPPIQEAPGGPIWSEEQVDRWLGARQARDQKAEALGRLELG